MVKEMPTVLPELNIEHSPFSMTQYATKKLVKLG